MAYSEVEFTYSGGPQVFETNFALGVLEVDHIKVYVDGQVDGLGDPLEFAFTYDSLTGEVTVTDTLTIGWTGRIARITPVDSLIVNFETNADVTKRNLARATKQTLMVVQELTDSREADSQAINDAIDLVEELDATIDASVAAAELAADEAEAAAIAAEAAAAAAAVFDPTLYLTKAGNLSGLTDTTAAQTALGSSAIGRTVFAAADAAAIRAAIAAQVQAAVLTALSGLGASLVSGDLLVATGASAFARLPKGVDGKFLGYAGGTVAVVDAPAVPVTSYQVFTANGTWTKPGLADPNAMVWIEAWAGGGAGSRDGTNSGGGGGGQYKRACYRAGDLPATISITVGQGGVANSGTGTAGGNTVVAGRFTCNGGAAHVSGSATAALGGNATAFTDRGIMGMFLDEPGGDGSVNGAAVTGVNYAGGGGRGGSNGLAGGVSLYGGNGGIGGDGTPAAGAGVIPGGGGGGVLAGSGVGGDGARGEVRIWVV